MSIPYLKDEDGNPELYPDGTPVPDLGPGYGTNWLDPAATAFVEVTLADGAKCDAWRGINDEYANGYIEQQKKLFPEASREKKFVIRHRYAPAGTR